MSNKQNSSSTAFEAWRASVVRTPGNVTTRPIVQPVMSSPAPVSAIANDPKPHDKNDQHTKGKKFQPVPLAAIAPNFAGSPQQIAFPRNTNMSNNRHSPYHGNVRHLANQAQQGGRRAAERWGARRPVDVHGLSRGMNGLAVGGLRIATAPLRTEPPTTFTNFEGLPYELRLQIWGHALNNSDRILEVIWDGAEIDLKEASHYHYRLSPRSCRPPALLHVCAEAREEALKIYTLVDFTTTLQNAAQHFKGCGTIMPYYSPKKDTILFGEQTCMWSIVRLIKDLRRASVDVERVAILSSGLVVNCHDWDHDDPLYGPDEMDMTYGYAIAGGCTVMQALHGRHEDVAMTTMASGVQGLKEVYFVVPTHLLPGIAGNVDDSITFRPARGGGMTKGQITVKNNLQREVDLVDAGNILPRCSINNTMNNWAGDSKPSFQFVSLTPQSYVAGMVFDSMVISSNDTLKLHGNNWHVIKKAERSSGCRIKIPKQDYPTQPFREIGFYGTASGIAQAEKLLRDRLTHLSASNWKAPKYPRFAPGYTESLSLKFGPGAAASAY